MVWMLVLVVVRWCQAGIQCTADLADVSRTESSQALSKHVTH
jgi:hypothetical protein